MLPTSRSTNTIRSRVPKLTMKPSTLFRKLCFLPLRKAYTSPSRPEDCRQAAKRSVRWQTYAWLITVLRSLNFLVCVRCRTDIERSSAKQSLASQRALKTFPTLSSVAVISVDLPKSTGGMVVYNARKERALCECGACSDRSRRGAGRELRMAGKRRGSLSTVRLDFQLHGRHRVAGARLALNGTPPPNRRSGGNYDRVVSFQQ